MTTTDACWDQMWLPLWPLASDDLKAGIYRTSREKALGRRYIEANPEAISNLLVVDIDHDDALLRAAYDREGWRPNAVVENPTNGHAHAVWALREPVTRTEYAHRAPLAFAAAVTEGLRRSVDGDAAYSGLMTKNPEHLDWCATWCTDELYDLGGLAAALDTHGFMPPPSWKRTRRRAPVGLGRNCALFESARTWAYREIRHHFGDPDGLAVSIRRTAHQMNTTDFSDPLPAREVDQISASIHRWIVTRSRMWADGPAVYEATFSTIQSARGLRSGVARSTKRADVLALIQGGTGD